MKGRERWSNKKVGVKREEGCVGRRERPKGKGKERDTVRTEAEREEMDRRQKGESTREMNK